MRTHQNLHRHKHKPPKPSYCGDGELVCLPFPDGISHRHRHKTPEPSDEDLNEIERGGGTLMLAVAEPFDGVCAELDFRLDPSAIDADEATLHRLIGQHVLHTEEERVALETLAGANQRRFLN